MTPDLMVFVAYLFAPDDRAPVPWLICRRVAFRQILCGGFEAFMPPSLFPVLPPSFRLSSSFGFGCPDVPLDALSLASLLGVAFSFA